MSTPAKFPPNFSWVIDGLLAALAFPSDPGHMQYLLDHGVQHLVSLTAERKPDTKHFPELQWSHVPIADYMPPSLDQIIQCVGIIDEAKRAHRAVALHCAKGNGRTGTVIACYLVKCEPQVWTPEKAISEVRRMRPGSIETAEQETMVYRYTEYLMGNRHL